MASGLYIPIYCNLPQHPRFRRLCRVLGVQSRAEEGRVLGAITGLWIWTMTFFKDGKITSEKDEIADACYHDGEPDQWVDALVEAGFLSEIAGGYEVRDWEDYGGKLLDKRQKTASRMAKMRERKDKNVRVTCASHSVTCASVTLLEKEKEKEKEKETDTDKQLCAKSKKKSAKKTSNEDAEKIFNAYPRRTGKAVALKAIEKALKKIDQHELLKAVEEYASSPYVEGADKQFIPHPATWFNQERWLDDRAEWQRTRTNGRNPPERYKGPVENQGITREETADWEAESERRFAEQFGLKPYSEVYGEEKENGKVDR